MRPAANSWEPPIDYDDEEKQDALRFLCSKMDARPLIRGINDIERLEAWEYVAEDLQLNPEEARTLRQRGDALRSDDADVSEFTPASEVEATGETQAVADGGAEVVVAEEAAERATTEPESETMEYSDDAEYESKLRDAERLCQMFDTVDEVEEKLEDERDRDVVRPHVVEALEIRKGELSE